MIIMYFDSANIELINSAMWIERLIESDKAEVSICFFFSRFVNVLYFMAGDSTSEWYFVSRVLVCGSVCVYDEERDSDREKRAEFPKLVQICLLLFFLVWWCGDILCRNNVIFRFSFFFRTIIFMIIHRFCIRWCWYLTYR